MWEGYIGKTLRAHGFGTLSYNFRGQVETRFDPLKELSPNLIVNDLIKLLQATTPKRPVLVGLSIGVFLLRRPYRMAFKQQALC